MTYDRYIRQIRLEARLSSREIDRRDMKEVYSWTRYRPVQRVGKVAVALFALWTLEHGQLGHVVSRHETLDACVKASFSTSYLTGQETRCLNDYTLKGAGK